MPTTIDQLQIEVETKSEKAHQGLNKLKATLQSLNKAAQSSGLDVTCKKLEKIASLDFSNLSSLTKLAQATKPLQETSKQIRELTESVAKMQKDIDFSVNTGEIQKASDVLGELQNQTTSQTDSVRLENARAAADDLIKTADAAKLLEMKLSGVKTKLAEALQDPNASQTAIASLTEQAQNLQMRLDAAGSEAKQLQTKLDGTSGAAKRLSSNLNSVGKNASKSMKKAAKGVSQLLKIVLIYGGAFRAVQMVTQGVSEGLQNISKYNAETAASMSKLSTMSLYLKNSIGAALYPVIVAVTPALQTMTNAIVRALNAFNQFIAAWTGADKFIKAKEYVQEYGETAKKTAAQIKKSFAGIDEITVIGQKDSGAGSNTPDYSQMFEESAISDNVLSTVDKVKSHLDDILWTVGAIGLGLLAWKISESFLGSLGAIPAAIGAVLMIDSVRGILKDGLDLGDIIKGVIGGALLGAAIGFKLGGISGAIGVATIGIGVSLLISGITSIVSEGLTTENAITAISGALVTAGGIYLTVRLFNKKVKNPMPEMDTATKTLDDVSTGSSKLTGTLKDLAKNLALGLVILLEVAAAAIIVVGAVWVLGKELEQVGIAWTPVIENGSTVAIAMGIGVGLLAGIGVVTALLGSVGTSLLANIAIGIAMLAELGVATGLFLAEIWGIGKGLDEIGQAWQPVLDNGESIATAIGIGTGLLIGVGVVAAALGAATVASAGALPLAIGLGTVLLVELGGATVLFVESLVVVADALNNDLSPALDRLNTKLPALTDNMKSFTAFMTDFAGQVVVYSASSSIAGFASTVNTIVGFFMKDPIQSMANDADKQCRQASVLNEKLRLANPELKTAIDLSKTYYSFLEELEKLTGKTNNVSLANGMFVSMKKVGENLVLGFVDGIRSKNNSLSREIKNVFGETFSDREAQRIGKDFGRNIGDGIAKALKSSWFPTLHGSVDVKQSGFVTLKLSAYANGGFPAMGEMFVARENGPEMIGTIGNKSAVANNDQIVSGIQNGVYAANQEQNSLLREQNALLRKLLEKETTVYSTVSTSDIEQGLLQRNRRNGKSTVPVG